MLPFYEKELWSVWEKRSIAVRLFWQRAVADV